MDQDAVQKHHMEAESRLLASQMKAKGKWKATLLGSKAAAVLEDLSVLPSTTIVLVSLLHEVP